jgi:hypothetical protein
MSMTMPFGKHKGESVETLPKRYLKWLQKEVDLREPLATAVDCAIRGKPYIPPKPPKSMEQLVDEIVKPFDVETLKGN